MSSPTTPRRRMRSYNSGYESDDAFIRGRETSFDSRVTQSSFDTASLSPDWDKTAVSDARLTGRVSLDLDSKKIKISSYITPQRHLKLYFPGRFLHSDTISASLGSIQPYATVNARRLLIHISTTVYSQVLIYTAECTGAM